MTTNSRYTTVLSIFPKLRDPSMVALLGLLALIVCGGASAQINIDDLKIRAGAGDKTATRQLAEAYYLGKGVDQNFKEAAQWYEKLAKQGDARAQTSLGLMYARGYGVEKNIDTARKWWSFAAAQNDPGAQYNLGIVYAEGQGIAKDDAQAAHWYGKAAMSGHLQAQHNLGLLYFEGRGVEKNLRRAYYWLAVAALQGDDAAQEAVKRVAALMPEDQIRDADAQARDWMKRAKKIRQ